jgi:DNA-damage-inducible protein J
MKVVTSLRLEKKNKEFAKKFFKQFNLTLSDGINMFLAKIAMDKKLPFNIEYSNSDKNISFKEVAGILKDYKPKIKDFKAMEEVAFQKEMEEKYAK